MNSPSVSVSQVPEIPNPLARADALEAEITELCAHINAASYRLLQLVAELDDEEPWGAWDSSLATVACCTSPRISPAIHSISAVKHARCRRRCSERCKLPRRLDANFRAAPMGASSMRITSNTGQTAARRRSTISCYCAAVTIVSCTKADSVSRRSPTATFVSRGPMAGH